MCWFQGEDDLLMPKLNKICIKKWIDLNQDWKVNVLTSDTIHNYVPEYFEIDNQAPSNHHWFRKSELLRLILLSKFGGVWVDASVLPIQPLTCFYDDIVNEADFFSYRFLPRHKNKFGATRETVTWFLIAKNPGNYLIERWKQFYINYYLNNTEWDYYYQMHVLLCQLYDSDKKIRNTIDSMVQIDAKIPLSASKVPFGGSWKKRKPSYLYKRPNIKI